MARLEDRYEKATGKKAKKTITVFTELVRTGFGNYDSHRVYTNAFVRFIKGEHRMVEVENTAMRKELETLRSTAVSEAGSGEDGGYVVDPAGVGSGVTRRMRLKTAHRFPIGSMVEIPDGVRMFVIGHTRDCDGSPLYTLTAFREDFCNMPSVGVAWDYDWIGGVSEEGMVLIQEEKND